MEQSFRPQQSRIQGLDAGADIGSLSLPLRSLPFFFFVSLLFLIFILFNSLECIMVPVAPSFPSSFLPRPLSHCQGRNSALMIKVVRSKKKKKRGRDEWSSNRS